MTKLHLVGSLAFETRDEALDVIARLAPSIDWIPDGETGERRKWLSQHRRRFEAIAQLEEVGPMEFRQFKLAAGASAADVTVPSPGYADAAADSYARFAELKQAGRLRPDARFLVAMATPFATLHSFVAREDRDALEAAVDRAFKADVDRILAELPHGEIAVQWDVCSEILLLEHTATPSDDAGAESIEDATETVIDHLVRIGEWIPADVPLAYHYCWSSRYGMHVIEPADQRFPVALTNALVERLSRPIERIHTPVPSYRDDVAYFAPLRDLRYDGELYLGLIHPEDGVEGARRRIAAARQVVGEFGVACECGTGRTPADPERLLALHEEVARAAAEPLDDITPEAGPKPRPAPKAPEGWDELPAMARTRDCPECGARSGEPCRDRDGSEPDRPHLDRWHAGMLAKIRADRERLRV